MQKPGASPQDKMLAIMSSAEGAESV